MLNPMKWFRKEKPPHPDQNIQVLQKLADRDHLHEYDRQALKELSIRNTTGGYVGRAYRAVKKVCDLNYETEDTLNDARRALLKKTIRESHKINTWQRWIENNVSDAFNSVHDVAAGLKENLSNSFNAVAETLEVRPKPRWAPVYGYA